MSFAIYRPGDAILPELARLITSPTAGEQLFDPYPPLRADDLLELIVQARQENQPEGRRGVYVVYTFCSDAEEEKRFASSLLHGYLLNVRNEIHLKITSVKRDHNIRVITPTYDRETLLQVHRANVEQLSESGALYLPGPAPREQ